MNSKHFKFRAVNKKMFLPGTSNFLPAGDVGGETKGASHLPNQSGVGVCVGVCVCVGGGGL